MCEAVSVHEIHRPFTVQTARLIDACAAVGTSATCPRRRISRTNPDGRELRQCPIATWIDGLNETGMSDDHRDLIVADRLGQRPLKPCAPLAVVTALVLGEATRVQAGPEKNPQEVALTGHETLVALMGARGIGKTLAASYLLSRLGGQLLLAYRFGRPGLEIDALGALQRPLVIDSLGREYQNGNYALSQLEEVIELRRARRRLTLLTANMTRAQFAKTYDGILDDRLNENAAFVCCYGPSRRGM